MSCLPCRACVTCYSTTWHALILELTKAAVAVVSSSLTPMAWRLQSISTHFGIDSSSSQPIKEFICKVSMISCGSN